jgi:hypothetical protein
MLSLVIKGVEVYDEKTQTFSNTDDVTIQLEHSLISISKWESKWEKPFLANKEKRTSVEILDYIRCMTIGKVSDDVYNRLDQENIHTITQYMDRPMTATTVTEKDNKGKAETLTSELLYFYMISFNIPFECEKWPLNRLITLIRVCSVKNQKPEKMSKQDAIARHRQINKARRAKSN